MCVIDCNGLFTVVARQRLLCAKEDILHNRVLQGGIERSVHRVGGNLTEKHQACLGEIWPVAALCRRYLVWKLQYTWDYMRCSTYTIRQRGEIICKLLRQSNRGFTIYGGYTLLINFVNHIQLLDKRGLPKCWMSQWIRLGGDPYYTDTARSPLFRLANYVIYYFSWWRTIFICMCIIICMCIMYLIYIYIYLNIITFLASMLLFMLLAACAQNLVYRARLQ